MNYLFKNNISAASATDRILEYISLAMGILIITLSIVFYLQVPERIPIHFTGTGGLFMSMLWMTASPQLGFSPTRVFPIFALCLLLMFTTVFIYYILVWRAGRS